VYVALTSVPLGATGPIVRCLEGGSDAAAPGFRWSCLRLSGDARAALAPHGLWFDGRGVLWIKTDVLLAADPVTGHVRRFLAAPRPGGITDVATTTDARTLFVTIQYGRPAGAVPPRTATLAVRRADAGVVGG
jgi:secreted PhoX family phosphatase